MGTIWSREYGWFWEGRDPDCIFYNPEARKVTTEFISYRWGKFRNNLQGQFGNPDFWDYDWDSDGSW